MLEIRIFNEYTKSEIRIFNEFSAKQKEKVKMKSEAILTVDLNEEEGVSVDARGQTSDSTVLNVLSEVPEGYVWRKEVETVEDLLSYEDLLFLFKQAENVSRDGYEYLDMFYLDKAFTQHCADKDVSVTVDRVFFGVKSKQLSFECNGRYVYVSLTELANRGYYYVRAKILIGLYICSFRDFPAYYPEGVSNDFVAACAAIDDDIALINDSFLSVAFRLHQLKAHGFSSLIAYGCCDIYEFAKRRFGFGTTTTKNFLAIYDKFMITDGMNTPMLKEEFKDYGYSQLVELVPVESHLDEFSPSMTVKEIRKKKKELSSAGRDKADKIEQQHIDDLSPNTNDVPDPVPVKTVPFEEVLSILEGIVNPYYEAEKEKQSARCDAYRRAVEDVIKAFKAKFEE